MAVKIKGMEMPKSCQECNFCIYINSGISLYCSVVKEEVPFTKSFRSKECPLKEQKELV